ncbi:MAG: OsmC family protein [candidate division KSB1 bacterium]|nr:OsmC family protein [candidate division KSB1 bacterium]MDZ7272700.1 OsmC family protein [candidate division KSB1 bacterium]MDZ7284277.1 OsmC family protein [candidate division KSB1 bacterium]MDZ7297327.1 OsmC family protein [candidate division KSB1 bacterium]MDZ7308395.1 OsmC family protein [candidate division KSB1 bacterium]
MKRQASAVWQGTLKEGKGTLSTQSGTLQETPYNFSGRFESGTGTNPEELIAAAHAGCFTMALGAKLSAAGFPPEKLSTRAHLTLEQVQGNWTITTIHLELTGKVPGVSRAKFDELANDARANCIVSRALTAQITLDAKLEA